MVDENTPEPSQNVKNCRVINLKNPHGNYTLFVKIILIIYFFCVLNILLEISPIRVEHIW